MFQKEMKRLKALDECTKVLGGLSLSLKAPDSGGLGCRSFEQGGQIPFKIFSPSPFLV